LVKGLGGVGKRGVGANTDGGKKKRGDYPQTSSLGVFRQKKRGVGNPRERLQRLRSPIKTALQSGIKAS